MWAGIVILVTHNMVQFLCATYADICCIVVNKEVTKKAFNFPTKHNLPLFFASAADGTNVVTVIPAMNYHIREANPLRPTTLSCMLPQMFEEAISLGYKYKNSDKPDDFMQDVMSLLEEVSGDETVQL